MGFNPFFIFWRGRGCGERLFRRGRRDNFLTMTGRSSFYSGRYAPSRISGTQPKKQKEHPPNGGRCALVHVRGNFDDPAKVRMVAGKAHFADIPPQIRVGYAAARKKHSACRLSFRLQPEHRVRLFSLRQDRRAAQRLRNRRRCLTVAQTPRAAMSAGDKQPAGQQHCGQKFSLFSFKG